MSVSVKGKIVPKTVIMPANTPLPEASPVNTLVVQRELSSAALRYGVAVYGDETEERYTRTMMYAEAALARQEQLILMDYGVDAFGLMFKRGTKLAVRNRMHRFGAGLHGYDLNPTHGEIHGKMAAANPQDCFVYDLDAFDYEQTVLFLAAQLRQISMAGARAATVILPAYDAMTLRRRQKTDTDVVLQAYSTIKRGFHKGIKFIIGASSPGEIPVELRNVVRTPVICRSTSKQQVLALDKIVDNIDRFSDIIGRGVQKMPTHDHFAWPFVDATSDLPIHLPHLNLITEVGGGEPMQTDSTTHEDEMVTKILDAVAERDGPKPNPAAVPAAVPGAATTSRKVKTLTASTSATAKTVTEAKKQTNAAKNVLRKRLQRSRVVNAKWQVEIARTMITIERGETIPCRRPVPADDVFAYLVEHRDVTPVALWMRRNYAPVSKIMSSRIAGAAHYMMARDNADMAITFMNGLIQPGTGPAASSALLAQLMNMTDAEAPLLSQKRLDVVMAAWRAHIGSNVVGMPTKTNSQALSKAA